MGLPPNKTLNKPQQTTKMTQANLTLPEAAKLTAHCATRETTGWGRGYRQRVYIYLADADCGYLARIPASSPDWKSFKIYKSATRQMRETIVLAKNLAARVNAGEITFKDAKALFEIPQH
jgi:hypothetical protein